MNLKLYSSLLKEDSIRLVAARSTYAGIAVTEHGAPLVSVSSSALLYIYLTHSSTSESQRTANASPHWHLRGGPRNRSTNTSLIRAQAFPTRVVFAVASPRLVKKLLLPVVGMMIVMNAAPMQRYDGEDMRIMKLLFES